MGLFVYFILTLFVCLPELLFRFIFADRVGDSAADRVERVRQAIDWIMFGVFLNAGQVLVAVVLRQ